MVTSPDKPTALPLSYRRSGRESNPRPVGPKLTEALRPVAINIQLRQAGMFMTPDLSLHRIPADARAGFEPAEATDNRQSPARMLKAA